MELLKREMDEQQKIIDLYTEKIEKNRQAGEGNSKETQQLEEKLIKARTAMAAMNNEYETANNNIPSLKDRVKELASNVGEGLAKAAEVAGKAVVASFAAIGLRCRWKGYIRSDRASGNLCRHDSNHVRNDGHSCRRPDEMGICVAVH